MKVIEFYWHLKCFKFYCLEKENVNKVLSLGMRLDLNQSIILAIYKSNKTV